jgi:hypothetical protein
MTGAHALSPSILMREERRSAMPEYEVDVLPGEVLQWIREDSRRKPQRLWVRASKEFRLEDESVAARTGEDELDLVAATGLLEISPQGGRGGWTLQLRAEGTAELRPFEEDNGEEDRDDITVDSFESEFLVPEHGEVEITLLADDAAARQRFQSWLRRRRASAQR